MINYDERNYCAGIMEKKDLIKFWIDSSDRDYIISLPFIKLVPKSIRKYG